MNKIKTIVVDDELEAREGIGLLLEDDPEIEILKLCKNGIEAIDMINDHKIDLMFLDIQMPVINGFEVVNSMQKERIPQIVFVTAYDQYAIKAFEVHAIDYILKPFTNQRFRESLQRAKRLINQENIQKEREKLELLNRQLHNKELQTQALIATTDEQQRLIVKEGGKVYFVPISNIIWLEAYDYYVKIHVKDHFYLVRESLKKLFVKLPEAKFLRIHKSSVINKDYVKSIGSVENGDYIIQLSNQQELKVGRSYREIVKNLLA